jgi:hypothetical protein
VLGLLPCERERGHIGSGVWFVVVLQVGIRSIVHCWSSLVLLVREVRVRVPLQL